MEKETLQILNNYGINAEDVSDKPTTCIDIDATGRMQEIENLASELGIEVEDSDIQYKTAIECVSLIGSVITIIDFLLKMKKKYGKTLLVGIQSAITKKVINIPVDDAIESIIRQHDENSKR